MTKRPAAPSIIVVHGDDDLQKSRALTASLDRLLPPAVDRGLALTAYDGEQKDDQGGPSLAVILEDLTTLPFLADRRVVLIRCADAFVSAHREALERYLGRAAPTGTLVLECRSFPKTTRLHKLAIEMGGEVTECKRLTGRALLDFVLREATTRGKRLDPAAAARLVELVGQDAGTLAAEIEKLALYALDRPAITLDDIAALVGHTREEKIFAVMDAAAVGRLDSALRLWQQTLATDPDAVFKVVGGLAYVLRRWLAAHEMQAEGQPIRAIAPRVMMWGREEQLQTLLQRLSPRRLHRALAALADLDSQAKSGTRSIDTGVETLLVRLAAR